MQDERSKLGGKITISSVHTVRWTTCRRQSLHEHEAAAEAGHTDETRGKTQRRRCIGWERLVSQRAALFTKRHVLHCDAFITRQRHCIALVQRVAKRRETMC